MGFLAPLWTRAQDKALLKFAERGASRLEAALRMGRSYDGIIKRARKLGARFKDYPRFRPWSPEEEARLYALLAEGATMYEASAVLKRGPHGVRYHAAKLGWRFMSPGQRALVRPGAHAQRGSSWTPAKVNQAMVWWRQRKSAAWIAKELGGLSRNAVIGMMHRRLRNDANRHKPQHTLDRQRQAKKNLPRKPGKVVTQVFSPPPKPEPVVVVLNDVAQVTHEELDGEHCRWPIGEPTEAIAQHAPLYCGAKRLAGLPYCRAHSARAFRAVSAFPRQSYPSVVKFP